MILIVDNQKAFATIKHEVLLQKLKAIKFSEQSIQWFRHYVCDRIFLVETENKLDDSIFSEPMALKVVNKIYGKLKFLYRKNKFLTPELR